MKIRKAELKDIDDIDKLYKDAVARMEEQGIDQWDGLYPTREIMEEDIRKDEMYLYGDSNKIYSVFVLNREYDDEYNKACWNYPCSNFIVLHRLCVNVEVQNKGIGTGTMKFIESMVLKENVTSIRLDAFSENPYSCRMYEKVGYGKVGEAIWRKGLFYLYEKKI